MLGDVEAITHDIISGDNLTKRIVLTALFHAPEERERIISELENAGSKERRQISSLLCLEQIPSDRNVRRHYLGNNFDRGGLSLEVVRERINNVFGLPDEHLVKIMEDISSPHRNGHFGERARIDGHGGVR